MRRLAKKVVVTARCFEATLDLLRPRCAVVSNASVEPWSRAELIERAHDAHALLCFMTDTVDAELLDACPNLSLVACALKGFDNFDVAECARRNVAVTAVPDLLTAPTAELALALALGLGRRTLEATRACVRYFQGWRPTLYGSGLAGATVGVFGAGAVGQAVAAGSRASRRRRFSTTTSPRWRRKRSAPSGSPGATAASRACSRAPTFSLCARRSHRRRATPYAARRSKTPSRGSA